MQSPQLQSQTSSLLMREPPSTSRPPTDDPKNEDQDLNEGERTWTSVEKKMIPPKPAMKSAPNIKRKQRQQGKRRKQGQSSRQVESPEQLPKQCFILAAPREVRPVGIVPGVVRYKVYKGKARGGCTEKLKVYSYQWEGKVEDRYDTWQKPPLFVRETRVPVRWTAPPTKKESAYLISSNAGSDGVKISIPSYYHEGLGVDVRRSAHFLGEKFGYEIIHRANIEVRSLFGLALLRPCRQIADEATEIFYKENTFVFPEAYHEDDEDANTKYLSWMIPGKPSKDGTPASRAHISSAVDRIFNPDVFQPLFLHRDPLTRLFAGITRRNAADLRSIGLEGTLKTGGWGMSFGTVLNMQTLVLNRICGNLKNLVLDSVPESRSGDTSRDALSGNTDDEKIYGLVGKVVLRLPSLQKLQLGISVITKKTDEYGTHWTDEADRAVEWGSALKWSRMVAFHPEELQELRAQEEMKVDAEEQAARDRRSMNFRKGRYHGGRDGSGRSATLGAPKIHTHMPNTRSRGQRARASQETPRANPFDFLVDRAAARAGIQKS